MAQNLSFDGVDVLKWVWSHEEGPVTVGDLLRARDQIRSGRVRKLAMARAQHRALEDALAPKPIESAQPAEQKEPRMEPTVPVVPAAPTAPTAPRLEPKQDSDNDSIPTLTAQR